MLTKADLITTRPGIEPDKNFILATWLRALYYGNDFFHEIHKDVFMKNYHFVLERFLRRPDIHVKVACLKEDSSVILGYSVYRQPTSETSILDFLFVKSAWRQIGIGKSLVPTGLHSVTHLTKVGKAVKPNNVQFNPFLF